MSFFTLPGKRNDITKLSFARRNPFTDQSNEFLEYCLQSTGFPGRGLKPDLPLSDPEIRFQRTPDLIDKPVIAPIEKTEVDIIRNRYSMFVV
jgi:hypothetical protein